MFLRRALLLLSFLSTFLAPALFGQRSFTKVDVSRAVKQAVRDFGKIGNLGDRLKVTAYEKGSFTDLWVYVVCGHIITSPKTSSKCDRIFFEKPIVGDSGGELYNPWNHLCINSSDALGKDNVDRDGDHFYANNYFADLFEAVVKKEEALKIGKDKGGKLTIVYVEIPPISKSGKLGDKPGVKPSETGGLLWQLADIIETGPFGNGKSGNRAVFTGGDYSDVAGFGNQSDHPSCRLMVSLDPKKRFWAKVRSKVESAKSFCNFYTYRGISYEFFDRSLRSERRVVINTRSGLGEKCRLESFGLNRKDSRGKVFVYGVYTSNVCQGIREALGVSK